MFIEIDTNDRSSMMVEKLSELMNFDILCDLFRFKFYCLLFF